MMEQEIVCGYIKIEDKGRYLEAEAQGYKDEICPKCNLYLAPFHHFIDCKYAREGDCPISDDISLLDRIFGTDEVKS